jgi:hypothetical protein
MFDFSVARSNNICDIVHPDYATHSLTWQKWRLTYEGGRDFIDRYLKKYSSREDVGDFASRKEISYNPAFAKAGIDDVKNSIYQRMADITRTNGSLNYMNAIQGLDGGVDLKGSTMNKFIGCELLPELLSMGKVGVFIDMPQLQGNSVADNQNARPYIYLYKVEDIRSWIIDEKNNSNDYESVLLQDCILKVDEKTGFPIGTTTVYRHLWRQDGIVLAELYDEKGDSLHDEPVELKLDKIPFVILELTSSLLTDICDYQISLLNLASADIAFALKANFPFYVEQYDTAAEMAQHLMSNVQGDVDSNTGSTDTTTEGTEAVVKAANKEIKVGVTHGRRYPEGTDPPSFIHPSSEPMEVSMAKQEQLKSEIRLLLNLAVTNMKPTRASAESKAKDDGSLEAGLSYIGLTLENAERQIAEIWSTYEGNTSATIKYPEVYSLKTDDQRREESNDLFDKMEKIPSSTYQKEIAKRAVKTLLGTSVSRETLQTISKEIDKAPNMTADPEVIRADVETGLVSKTLGSKLRGYPDGEADKAKKEHVDRLAAIAEAQAEAKEDQTARGVADLGSDPNASKGEKKQGDNKPDAVKQRGDGKEVD